MYDFFKGILGDDSVFYALLLIVVGVGSFGLGRVELPEAQTSAPAMVTVSQKNVSSVASKDQSQVVASKNGSKYHYLWCPGTKHMKEENKVFFASIAEARAAGYEPAANCQGLE